MDSPIGYLRIEGNDAGVTAVAFAEGDPGRSDYLPPPLQAAKEQLQAYFEGTLRTFDLPLAPAGTDFQQSVWNVLRGLPYGRTASYLDIALLLGNEKATRAVGAANGRNPVPIIVPCHRVIGAKGKLTGYAGEVWRKKWLLEHEARHTQGHQQSLF